MLQMNLVSNKFKKVFKNLESRRVSKGRTVWELAAKSGSFNNFGDIISMSFCFELGLFNLSVSDDTSFASLLKYGTS